MKTCFCIYVLLFMTIFIHRIAVANKVRTMETIEKQDTKDSLTLSVALPEKCYAGERIDLVITITNQRKDDVVYYESSLGHDFNMMVVDSRGKSVSPTVFGNLMFPKGKKPVSRLVKKTLSSGKEIRLTINLARIFDLTIGEDNYTLYLSRELFLNEKNAAKRKRVKLKLEIPFKVSEPPK